MRTHSININYYKHCATYSGTQKLKLINIFNWFMELIFISRHRHSAIASSETAVLFSRYSVRFRLIFLAALYDAGQRFMHLYDLMNTGTIFIYYNCLYNVTFYPQSMSLFNNTTSVIASLKFQFRQLESNQGRCLNFFLNKSSNTSW